MPFIAVVYLHDEQVASEFLEHTHPIGQKASTGRVVGMYRFPKRDVKLCRSFSGGCRHQAWKRHKFGHWVHSCGLRNPQWWKQLSLVLIDKFGINLLPRDHTPRLFQNPEQWEGPIELGVFGDIPEFLKGP